MHALTLGMICVFTLKQIFKTERAHSKTGKLNKLINKAIAYYFDRFLFVCHILFSFFVKRLFISCISRKYLMGPELETVVITKN